MDGWHELGDMGWMDDQGRMGDMGWMDDQGWMGGMGWVTGDCAHGDYGLGVLVKFGVIVVMNWML